MDKKSIFFLGISILILIIMLWFVGIDKVIDALKLANMTLLLLALLVQVFLYFLYTLRWQILNKLADMDVSIKKLLPMVLVGLAVNNITPSGRGGGEPVRAYILSKENEEYHFEGDSSLRNLRMLILTDCLPEELLQILMIPHQNLDL